MRFNFKKYFSCLFLISPLLLATCQKSPTGPQPIENLFPLAVGNYWVYEGKICNWYCSDSEIWEEIIGNDTLSDGTSVFVKRKIFRDRDATFSDTAISYLKFEGNELREYLDKNYSCQFKILLKVPLRIGAEWNIDSCFCRGCPVELAITDSVEAVENIDVPAGNFKNCYRIVTGKVFYPDTRWFAPYIGITKSTWEIDWWNATYVLKEYRVR